MTALWLVAAAALLGTRPRRRKVRRPDAAGRDVRRAGPGVAVGLAASGAAAACVAVAGIWPGAALAAGAGPLVWWWLGRLLRADPRARSGPDPALPLVLDLCAASLRAGRPPADALASAAPAAAADVRLALEQVAGLVRLGAAPEQAWAVLARDGPLGEVAVVAVRSAASGARLAAAFERLATDIRAELATVAAARAQRAGVSALGPLAACFLPSFVLLGIVPVVVGMGREVLGGGLI